MTHPNDLYAGEKAVFQFLLDGKPAAGLAIGVTAGERRYRNAEETLQYTADKEGKVVIEWPRAGQYFLEAESEGGKVEAPASKRSDRYTAVFEVLPQ